jgi:hypothetical protein
MQIANQKDQADFWQRVYSTKTLSADLLKVWNCTPAQLAEWHGRETLPIVELATGLHLMGQPIKVGDFS